ncbi:MAG: phytanoyl-CoA dioxygenase family protein [Acidimicrobiia bacterium]
MTSGLLANVDALHSEGRLLESLDALTEANKALRDPEIERRLVGLRHEAVAQMRAQHEAGPWPAVEPSDPLPTTRDELPVVDADAVSPELVSTGILRHGCLHVRGMLREPEVTRLVEAIDRAFAAYDAHVSGAADDETAAWFDPFKPGRAYSAEVKRKFGNKRGFVREAGGVWAVDSPRGMFELFDVLHEVGLARLVRAYLGERPALAIDKCTLRRVGQISGTDWHQDGAFLGEGIRTINVWMALSDCGRDAPGLDVVPRRLNEIVETGTEGAVFPWAVGPGVVERVSAAAVCRPTFEAGDVLLFDEMFLHRTALDPSMTRERYAVETWFFAPSVFPDHYLPLAF